MVKILFSPLSNILIFNQLILLIVLPLSTFFSLTYHAVFSSDKKKIVLFTGSYLFAYAVSIVFFDRRTSSFHLIVLLSVLIGLAVQHLLQIRKLKRNPFFYSLPRLKQFRKKLYFLKHDDLSVLKYYPNSLETESATQFFRYRPDIAFGSFMLIFLWFLYFISGQMVITGLLKLILISVYMLLVLAISAYNQKSLTKHKMAKIGR